jgi:hypothetical protein
VPLLPAPWLIIGSELSILPIIFQHIPFFTILIGWYIDEMDELKVT